MRAIGQKDFHILLALFDAERHGYGIMKEVAELSNGTVRLGPGTLYGAIKRLFAAELIEESDRRPAVELDDKRRRCYYRLTATGRKVAVEECHRVADLLRVAQNKGAVSRGTIATTPGGL